MDDIFNDGDDNQTLDQILGLDVATTDPDKPGDALTGDNPTIEPASDDTGDDKPVVITLYGDNHSKPDPIKHLMPGEIAITPGEDGHAAGLACVGGGRDGGLSLDLAVKEVEDGYQWTASLADGERYTEASQPCRNEQLAMMAAEGAAWDLTTQVAEGRELHRLRAEVRRLRDEASEDRIRRMKEGTVRTNEAVLHMRIKAMAAQVDTMAKAIAQGPRAGRPGGRSGAGRGPRRWIPWSG